MKKMSQDSLAPNTIKTRFNNVRSVFRGAVQDRVIAADPSVGVKLPRARKNAFAGLRIGEASAVQLGDVDFLRRTLTVSRQVQRPVGAPAEVRLPKYGSERVVHIPEALVLMLSQHVQRYGTRGTKQWLFSTSGDLPVHVNTISEWWRKLVRVQGLHGVRMHDCRHFFASGLIAAGCDVVTVQRAMGHSSATTTLNTYSYLWPTAEDRTRAAAAELMLSAVGQPTTTAAHL